MRWLRLAGLLVVLLQPCTEGARQPIVEVVVEPAAKPTTNVSDWDPATDGAQLQLCECEQAVGYPAGLGCNGKEGWFISNFEHQGTWIAGGGLVPLSPALCCRPCMPTEIPAEQAALLPAGAQPVALVSIGCHPAVGRGPRGLTCEPDGDSFVAGFSDAEPVGAFYSDTYYPLGQVECCTPALLLSTGDAWQLTRCNCQATQSKDCGGLDTNRLLWGFDNYRTSRTGAYLPVAPLACCGLCLGTHVHTIHACAALNYCSGNGICMLGSCQCFQGYGGSDCGQMTGGGGGGRLLLPPWLAWGIVSLSCFLLMLASLLLRISCRVRRHRAAASESDDDNGRQEPLLMRLEDEGSVGTQDTEDVVQRATAVAAAVAAWQMQEQQLQQAQPQGGEHRSDHDEAESVESLDEDVSPMSGGYTGSSTPHAEEAEAAQPSTAAPAVVPQAAPCNGDRGNSTTIAAGGLANSTGPPTTAHNEQSHNRHMSGLVTSGSSSGSGGGSPPHSSKKDTGSSSIPEVAAATARPAESPFASGLCTICMERAIQVALVPCGHANLCRHCSRRVDRCPFCRKEI